jgi:hypothetical protein
MVSKVRVRLLGFSHTFPDDVDVLLVGPLGQKFIVMSDAGGSADAVNATLTLDDAAAALVPDNGPIVTGTFRPTNIGGADLFPAPAPPAPYQSPATAGAATFASVFNGQDPNGNWSLFVVDDAGLDPGSMTGGWQVEITTTDPVCCVSPCVLTCPANITVNNDPNQCGAAVSFTIPPGSGSCGVVTSVPPSGAFFPVGTTTVTVTATKQDGTTTTCLFTVTVRDAQAPSIIGESASPNVLWPPNHKMKTVTVNYSVGDNCTPAASVVSSLSVTSNQPVNGPGDGNTTPDWEVINAHQVKLRAERAGGSGDRIYTITIRAQDAAGNVATKTVSVRVPHDQS